MSTSWTNSPAISPCTLWIPGANAELLGLMVNEPRIDPKELGRLTMPVLVIVGSRDMIKASHSRLIAASLPNGRLVTIEGDHFIANKRPGPFNQAVLEFLKEETP